MKKIATAITSAVMVFGITGVGASLLSLTGSDTAPGSAKTEAACVEGSLVVTNPVETGYEHGHTVNYVTVAGDMTACNGQTMLVEVTIDGTPSLAYGVYEFTTSDVTSLVFGFADATDPDATFTDTAPTVVDGGLVVAGDEVEPVKAKEYGQTDITIAQTWGETS